MSAAPVNVPCAEPVRRVRGAAAPVNGVCASRRWPAGPGWVGRGIQSVGRPRQSFDWWHCAGDNSGDKGEMPLGRLEVFDSTEDNWEEYIERLVQFLLRTRLLMT